MSFKYHNILWVFLSLVVLILIFTNINVDGDRIKNYSNEKESVQVDKNGLIQSFANDGKLKTEINYVNGIKHGRSKLYYRDGKTVHLDMPYRDGERHGISKKYYETGELYAETSYENDLLHGFRKTYYKNGKQKAEVSYEHGNPGTGLIEFLLDGKEKENPEIIYHQEANRLSLTTSSTCREKEFYLGELIQGQFFDKLDNELKRLPSDGDNYYVDLEIFSPSYLQYQDIICFCKSSQGNPLVLKERINTSSLKKVN